MELAENALTTLERLKLALGISADDVADDDFLILLINSASSWLERQLGRKLGRNDYEETYQPSGRQKQLVKNYPITKIYQIDFGRQVIDASLYVFDDVGLGEYGIIWKDDGWPYQGYQAGLAYDVVAVSRNLTIKYQAGYVLPKDATPDNPSTLPADLESLIWEMVNVNQQTAFGSAAGLSAYSISDVSWTFDKTQSTSWVQRLRGWMR